MLDNPNLTFVKVSGSGFIQFSFENQLENEFHFVISYFDDKENSIKMEYYYSFIEDKIIAFKTHK